MFSRSTGGSFSPARRQSLMSQNTKSVVGGRSGGKLGVDEIGVGQETQVARNAVLLEYATRLPSRLSAMPSASPAPSVSPSGFTWLTITNALRRAQLRDDLLDRRHAWRALDHSLSSGAECALAQRLGQRDRALGRTIFDENQLGRVAQIDLAPQLAAQEAPSVLERVERLPGLMPVADHRNEHLAVAQIVADFGARYRHERQSRILQLLRDQRAEDALNLVVDLGDALCLHARTSSAATCSSA